MNKVALAFIKAKKEFTPALKDKTNPHFKSKYADLGACIDAVNEALLNNGIAMYQETFQENTGVTVETVFLHESGESIRCGKLHVPAAKQDPQGYGSALTYARRYSLMAACGIAPEDDDGNAASIGEPEKPARYQQDSPKLTEKQIADIQALAEEFGVAITDICKIAKVASLRNIEAERYLGLVKWIKSKAKVEE